MTAMMHKPQTKTYQPLWPALALRLLGLTLLLSLAFGPLTSKAQTVAPPGTETDQAIVRQNLTLEFNDRFKTKAELDFPRSGQAPFPAVLFLGGSGDTDLDGTTWPPPSAGRPVLHNYKEIAAGLVGRGMAVYRYNKRGLDTGGRESNPLESSRRTNDRLVADAQSALDAMRGLPQVDKNRLFLVGHSQGTLIAAQLARQNPGVVQGLVLMGSITDWNTALDYQLVERYLTAAAEVDADGDGFLTLAELNAVLASDRSQWPNVRKAILLPPELDFFPTAKPAGGTETVVCNPTTFIILDKDRDCRISILTELKPALETRRANLLNNPRLLEASKESAPALQSLLSGPKLLEVLKAVNLPVLFQQGAEDERNLARNVEAVSLELAKSGLSSSFKLYPRLLHNFTPVEVALRLAGGGGLSSPQVVPAEVLRDQADWLLARLNTPDRLGLALPTVSAPTKAEPKPSPVGQLPPTGKGFTRTAPGSVWPLLALTLLLLSCVAFTIVKARFRR